ncbi:integrator complex subunit 4-like [Oppia nitens]|uniref:integrator complex subunit 4-like n=1 Tax=Oppia nitens TaxID=1686743 RepID=UPI0023D9BD23|nr:integrator complex subunit 4-like [Oppia nitens]
MAAHIKKRALAQFANSSTQEQVLEDKHKKLRLSRKSKKDESNDESALTTQDTHEELNQLFKSSGDAVNVSELFNLFQRQSRHSMDANHCHQIYKKVIHKLSKSRDSIVKMSYITAIKELITNFNLIEDVFGINSLIEDLLSLLKNESSHIVMAEILNTLHKLDNKFEINYQHKLNIVTTAKNLLQNSCNHIVKNECLLLLADFAPINQKNSHLSPDMNHIQMECIAIIKLLRDFSHYHDSRVRSTALSSILRLHERGVKLDISLYSEFCESLNDDYECARITAIRLLLVISQHYGDCLVFVNDGSEQIRLADDAFAKVCSMMSDPSMNVRAESALLLGQFTHISVNFLEQTLDKKLMSNLRKKKSAHERHRETYETGEWSSGQKWADDAPHEELCPDTVNLMNIGACGAFIHGLEDEFYEVRMATLESLMKLAQLFPTFALQALDFLVDMFNDEIEDIRLKAIQCLTQISRGNIVLREDQIDIILPVLKDFSIDIREALHAMLSNCKLSSKSTLKTCINNLLENLKRYPQDMNSIWKCFKKLGTNHPYLTLPLVPDLLGIHPFLDLPETSLEDTGYIAILIVVFNAAKECTTMTDLFEEHICKHYFYLRDTYPTLVPQLSLLSGDSDHQLDQLDVNEGHSRSHSFLLRIFERVRNVMSSESTSNQIQSAVLNHSIRDLQHLGEVEPSLLAASNFLCAYLQCQMSLRRILSNTNWINTFLLSALQTSSFRSSIQQLLSTTFSMVNRFYGLHPIQLVCIQETRLKVIALQLIAIIHGSNVSALALCEAFISEVHYLEKLLTDHNLTADSLTSKMIKEINLLDEPKPGTVARVLKPLFLSTSNSSISDLDIMLNEKTFNDLVRLCMTTATIHEPSGKSDTPLKFTAGLILGLPFDAIIENISDIKYVRIKIHYPDQQIQVVLPKLNDFRLIESKQNPNLSNYRLYTTVYLSHGVWVESCPVDISLVLDFRDTTSTTLTATQTWISSSTKGNAIKSTKSEDSFVIDICKPIRVYLSPKAPKKLVI